MEIIVKNRIVQVSETILVNKLPLPTLAEVKKELSAHKDEWTMNEDECEHIHFHSKKLGGKIYPQDNGTFKYVPYYSYEWTHLCEISGADNFPIIK